MKRLLRQANIIAAAVIHLLTASTLSAAQVSPQGITLQGTVLNSSGLPLEAANVVFTVQIRSPGAENCLLYQETQTLNMTSSGGAFSFILGQGTRSGTSFDATSTLSQVFYNSSAAMTSLTCTTGTSYTPGTGDQRKVTLSFDDGSGPHTVTQALNVQAVPYAMYADTLQGKTPTDFIQKNTTTAVVSQANLESVFNSNAAVTELLALMGGSSARYVTATGGNFTPSSNLDFNAKKITNLADPASAQDAATKNYCDAKIAGGLADTATLSALAAGDNGKVLTWDGAKWVAQTTSSADATKLPLAGGSMTGTLTMNNADIALTGTSKVTGQLSIYRSSRNGAGSSNVMSLSSDAKTAADEVGLNFTMFNASDAATPYAMIYSGITSPTAGSESGYLRFLARQASGGMTEAMRINASGNVGIGTTTPSSRLEVSGGAITAGPQSAAAGNGGEVRFSELASQGSNYVGFKAPDTLAANKVWTLPSADGTNGQVLTTDGAGVMSWASVSSGGLSAVSNSASLANGKVWIGDGSGKAQEQTLSGDVTITNAGVATVGKIQGTAVSATAPTADGQVIRYNGTQYEAKHLTVADLHSSVGPGYAQAFPTTSCTAGQTLTWVSITDTLACADITIASSKVTGLGTAATLNVGTGSSNIVQLDGSSKLPAVDGSALTTLNANNISSGTLAVARGGTGLTSGTSGGIPYFSSSSTLASSGALTQYQVVLGGGAGGAPTVVSGTGTSGQVLTSSGAGAAPSWSSVSATLGYTPVNKTGDALTGDLSVTRSDANARVTVQNSSSSADRFPGFVVINYRDAATGYPLVDLRSANGDSGSPSAIQSGNVLGYIRSSGYGATQWMYTTATIGFKATGNWTDSSTPTGITFSTTPSGSTSPSERMRIDSTGNVGIGSTSPEFLLTLDGDGSMMAKGTYGSGATLSTAGVGTRMFWYPRKAAFRAGYVSSTQWDDGSVGDYSVAFGQNNTASGSRSFAAGSGNTTSGSYSTSLGSLNSATGAYSFAANVQNTASGQASSAFGQLTTASGVNSMAIGDAISAPSYDQVSIGRYSVVGGETATSWVSTDPIFVVGVGTSPAARVNAVTVLKNSNVGIGTASPSYKFHVVGSSGATVAYFSDGAQSCSITPATAGNISCSSDERLKKDITRIDDAYSLEKILQLSTVTFRWRSGGEDTHTGYLAQEVEKVAPEMVTSGKDGYKQVSYVGFIPWITGAIKEVYRSLSDRMEKVETQNAKVLDENVTLQNEVTMLRAENMELKNRLEVIEQRLGSK